MIEKKSRSEINDIVFNWISNTLDKRKIKLLDIPCGFGYLINKLKENSFIVEGAEANLNIVKTKNIPIYEIDLNKTLKISDNSYDCITCLEGLEHTENPYNAIRELTRILKKDGYLIISLPNYSTIEKRFKFLLRGYLTKPKNNSDYIANGFKLFDFHNSILTITILQFIFEINSLKIIDIKKDKTKYKQLLFYPFIILLRLLNKKNEKLNLSLDNKIILGGNSIIFVLKKVV